MAAAAQKILGNQEARESAKNFFADADASRAGTTDEIPSALKAGKSVSIVGGNAFAYDYKVTAQLIALTKQCIKLLGASIAHEKDIQDAAWEVMKEPGIDADDRFKSFAGLLEEALKSTTFITNNYAVRLVEPITSATIGPVRIRMSNDIAAEFAASDVPLRIVTDGGQGSLKDGKITASLTPICWEVDLRATARRGEYLAKRMVNISLSLIRLVSLKAPITPGLPPYGSTEPDPFVAPQMERAHIRKRENGISWGGLELSRRYEIDKNIADRLSEKEFQASVALIFEPKNKSIGERVARGLHWMARARQSVDPAERFLLAFTAIEALLSADSVTAPVVDTVARRTGTILALSPKDRQDIFQDIKSLYTTRSDLVHRGIAEVSDSDARRLEYFTDSIYSKVIGGTNLETACTEFHKSLDQSGFGSEWPPANKQSPTASTA
ncbi:HEPN domain-containing protein [Hyphomicrobium sp. B1]|uniref:hypothetical protein n=1 Tax=Hyphomicrobium sp. B1 TaxID=3075651 RepID=UPI003C2FB784